MFFVYFLYKFHLANKKIYLVQILFEKGKINKDEIWQDEPENEVSLSHEVDKDFSFLLQFFLKITS